MFLSHISLRWYRSFNTLSTDRLKTDVFRKAAWNQIGTESFPFVSIELDPKITTIVGANEAGKSHVLSGITKAFRGEAGADGKPNRYDKQDVCRYCGFDHLETNHWPQFVIELTAEDGKDKKRLQDISGFGQELDKLWIRIDGSSPEKFATIYKALGDQPIKFLNQSDWIKLGAATLPQVRIIAADKALASEVHVKQLLDMYADTSPGRVYDPVALQDLADSMRGLNLAPGAAVEPGALAEYNALVGALAKMTIGPKEHGQLGSV